MKLITIILLFIAGNALAQVYVIPSNASIVDPTKIGTATKIVFSSANTYTVAPYFKNLKNVEITNQGPVNILPLKFENCSFLRLGGNGVDKFIISGGPAGSQGIQFYGKPTDIEVSYLEIFNVGFAGIMIKDDVAKRGTFTMRNIKIHDNYIHHTVGEGMYIGSSFWSDATKNPHELEGVDIYSNRIEYTGQDGIQVGCGSKGVRIFNNTVRNYGTLNLKSQNSGIQIGEGTGGLCYKNLIEKGSGVGLMVLGNATNIIFENEIYDAGTEGIFCDTRGTPVGTGFKFANNTIVNSGGDAILLYAKGLKNEIVNNTLINPKGGFIILGNGAATTDVGNVKMK